MWQPELKDLIRNYSEVKHHSPRLRVHAQMELDRRKGLLYNKWHGTFMEPILRDEIAILNNFLN